MGGLFLRLKYHQESRDFQLLEDAAVNRVLPKFHSVFSSCQPNTPFRDIKKGIKTERSLGVPSGRVTTSRELVWIFF